MFSKSDNPASRAQAAGSQTGIARSHVEAAVEAALGPYLGTSMARSAIDGHCRALGLGGERLAPAELAQLLERLQKGLALFVGRTKAARLIQGLEHAIDDGPLELL